MDVSLFVELPWLRLGIVSAHAQARFCGADTFLDPAPVLADWIEALEVYESAHLFSLSPSAISAPLIVQYEIDMGSSPYTHFPMFGFHKVMLLKSVYSCSS